MMTGGLEGYPDLGRGHSHKKPRVVGHVVVHRSLTSHGHWHGQSLTIRGSRHAGFLRVLPGSVSMYVCMYVYTYIYIYLSIYLFIFLYLPESAVYQEIPMDRIPANNRSLG